MYRCIYLTTTILYPLLYSVYAYKNTFLFTCPIRLAPQITEDTTAKLEELIIQRIKDQV